MEGYGDTSYGDAFADVYDDWYRRVSDTDATVAFVAELAGDAVDPPASSPGRVLELGVGTGRLAVPLAELGLLVHGVDTSTAMLDRLATADPHGRVAITVGDMAADLPPGPFDVVLVAYNTLFNLPSAQRQRECFAAVAHRLTPGGAFVVEAFVPDDPPRAGERVGVRSMTADRVVLDVSRHDPRDQRAEGHLIELSDGGPVRLRPWSIRYSFPSELDAMAIESGLELADRWSDFTRTPFGADSARHVSVYRHRSTTGPTT